MRFRKSALSLRLALSVISIALLLQAAGAATPQEMPQVKNKVDPEYPAILKAGGIEGEAAIQVLVNEAGGIDKAVVVKATHPAFGEAALAAIKQWTFTPGTKDGRPIKAGVTVPVRFRLGDKPGSGSGGELIKLREMVDTLLQGALPGEILSHVDQAAYIVLGTRYEHLWGLLRDPNKLKLLQEGPATKLLFTAIKTSPSEDAGYIVLRTKPSSRKDERFHTIVLMKSQEGIWKIAAWQAGAM